MPRRFLLILLFLLLLERSALAQDSSSKAGTPDAARTSSEPAGQSKTQDRVEPLDAWSVTRSGTQSTAKTSSSASAASKNEPRQVAPEPSDTELPEESEETNYQEPATPEGMPTTPPEVKPVNLNKQQLERIARVEAQIRTRALIYRQRMREKGRRDPRGRAEFTFCTVNGNNYGMPADVVRMFDKGELPRLLRRERALVYGIVKARCDAVAVQSIIGRGYSRAKAGLRRLATRVGRASGENYHEFVGGGSEQNVYNGFLVRAGAIVGDVVPSNFHDRVLPRFGDSQEKKFFRDPLEIEITVHGKDGAADRPLKLVTFDLARALRGAEDEPEAAKMQMAEALRLIVASDQRTIDLENPHILLVAGERTVNRTRASSAVLEGRYRLQDFKEGAKCTLNDDRTFSCSSPPSPLELFNVTTGCALPPLRTITKKSKDGKEVKFHLRSELKQQEIEIRSRHFRTAEIYMLPADLKYARSTEHEESSIKTGHISVRNGLRGKSPLLWVTLNW